MNISEKFIRQCSLTLGQFDSETTNTLVTLFHHQDACSQLTRLSNNLKEKFENLLTSKRDVDEVYNDTPLTRIELAVMIHFKQRYLSESIIDNDQNQSKLNIKFSIEIELNLAYCFLLAQCDDRLDDRHIDDLKLLFNIQQPVKSLFDIYGKLGGNFSNFFSLVIQSKYLEKRIVAVDQLIRDFQLFIKRYEDFLSTFEKYYKPLTGTGNNFTQTDNISNLNDTTDIFPLILIPKIREQIKPSILPPDGQSLTTPALHLVPSSSSNIPRKALCVIINIKAFNSSKSADTPKQRAGSDKDVELIKFVFKKLKFTVLECRYDFKKKDLNNALDHINDKDEYADFDCLVVFIMSHGLLHSFFTADSEEIIIRDIVTRYADSSPGTIWKGKTRIFFIQACRSLWPPNYQPYHREEIKENDLSPQMLVAYSCSANEASKRSTTYGSIFIQVLCIMILRNGHLYSIQSILDSTAKFVIKRDEFFSECKKKQLDIQRPEYLGPTFSSKFRFADNCLINKYSSWTYDEQSMLVIPVTIWDDIYDLIYGKFISNRQ